MEFIIDRSGAPAVKFSGNKYISVLPVTRYQFERFIWETAPDWFDYEVMFEKSGRVSPSDITVENVGSVFMTGLSGEEATKYARHFQARLPTSSEWDEVYDSIFIRKELFGEALEFLKSIFNKNVKIDKRILKLLEKLNGLDLMRDDINNEISELVFPFAGDPIIRINLKSAGKMTGDVMGQPAKIIRCEGSGFSVVLIHENEVKEPLEKLSNYESRR